MNKYLEKVAKNSLSGDKVRQAMKSRVPVRSHGIQFKDPLQKTAGVPAISKGFKFTPSTSGVAKTKPKLPSATQTLSPPKMVEQKVSNSNKTMIKSSNVLSKLRGVATFGKNTVMGAGHAVADSTMDVAQHAGGKKLRGFVSAELGRSTPTMRESFMSLPDLEKLKLSGDKAVDLQKLLYKRDAARVLSAVTLTGGVSGAFIGNNKLNQALDERRIRQHQKEMLRQYYERGGR